MLEKITFEKPQSSIDYAEQLDQLGEKLAVLEQSLKQAAIPAVILFEGWGAAGKGSMIARVIKTLDPRGFKVFSNVKPDEGQQRKPFLWRYWCNLPMNGNLAINDRSWYRDATLSRLEDGLSKEEESQRLDSINTFERQLTDSGCLVIKFFLHISKKEQKSRFNKLENDKSTEWRVREHDRLQNRNYGTYFTAFDEMITKTNTPNAPWIIVDSTRKAQAETEILTHLVNTFTAAVAVKQAQVPVPAGAVQDGDFPKVAIPQLHNIPLDKTISREEYDKELRRLKKRLAKLHNKLYAQKRPVVIVYEGWDAAGKGGNIKRISAALDPRGYEVTPIAAPDKTELAHHYLWRFWKGLPKTGHIGIFDRSWYGRVMVERVEGFCSEAEWKRAYREINEFEHEIHSWGAIVIKFWLQIDPDEQLRRFTERQNTPEKQWKITDEDWRNREKWDAYEVAVNEMLAHTSTEFAPWNVIESNDKKFARIKALKIVIKAIEREL